MPSLYAPSAKVFIFELEKNSDDGKILERHSFSWPESDEGQLELAAIINDPKKRPAVKLQNIKARTRHQDGKNHAAIETFYLPGEVLRSKEFMQQNRPRNSKKGEAGIQNFYPNGVPKEFFFLNDNGVCVNDPKGQPAEQYWFENGKPSKIVYQTTVEGRNKYHTFETNGPNGEPGIQEFYESGKTQSFEYFDYNEEGDPINRPDGKPTKGEFYPNGKVKTQAYAEGNGPRGFHAIAFDEKGVIELISYYDAKNRFIEADNPKKLALLGFDKDKHLITVSQKAVEKVTGIKLMQSNMPDANRTLGTSSSRKALKQG